jgi:glucan biosynthesis protein
MRTGTPLSRQHRARKFVLDFTWPTLAQDVANGVVVNPQIDVGRGRLGQGPISSEYNPETRLWRVAFDVIANESESSVDLRASIRKNDVPCTETWTYLWMP